ncbi:MAG: hypothetical protein EPO24_03225 [Bacteroidetes bacterium]|nr:MAG: hypothetical protein EPO24_03225 [Bacteroidota bacterium]
MTWKETISRAKANGHSAGQFVETKSVNVKWVMALLVECSMAYNSGVRRASHYLIEIMAEHEWQVAAGIHTGGYGGDERPHITIHCNGHGYHIRFSKNWNVFRITGHGIED